MKVKRVKTYVKGLDKMMGGGVPEGSMVLIAGKPGTMKSSFAFNILYHNIVNKKRNGVYITLEQKGSSLISSMDSLGMSIKDHEAELNILDLGIVRKKLAEIGNQTWMEVFRMYIKNLKHNLDIDLVIIDSLEALEVMAKFESTREELFHFIQWLKDMDVTAIMITEMEQGSEEFCHHGEDFLCDGILHLDMKREGNIVNLFLSVVKMRQTKHRRAYFPLIYDKDGFELVTQ